MWLIYSPSVAKWLKITALKLLQERLLANLFTPVGFWVPSKKSRASSCTALDNDYVLDRKVECVF